MKVRIGDKLLGIRDNRKLSQAEMAEILEIPSTTCARFERNEMSVELEKMIGFAAKLNIGIQELLSETLSITNNNNNSGQGGGVIFGNQYFYFSESSIINSLKSEIEGLKKKISESESKSSFK